MTSKRNRRPYVAGQVPPWRVPPSSPVPWIRPKPVPTVPPVPTTPPHRTDSLLVAGLAGAAFTVLIAGSIALGAAAATPPARPPAPYAAVPTTSPPSVIEHANTVNVRVFAPHARVIYLTK